MGGCVQMSTAFTQSRIKALSLTFFTMKAPGTKLAESTWIRPSRTGRYFRCRLDRDAGVPEAGRRALGVVRLLFVAGGGPPAEVGGPPAEVGGPPAEVGG